MYIVNSSYLIVTDNTNLTLNLTQTFALRILIPNNIFIGT